MYEKLIILPVHVLLVDKMINITKYNIISQLSNKKQLITISILNPEDKN